MFDQHVESASNLVATRAHRELDEILQSIEVEVRKLRNLPGVLRALDASAGELLQHFQGLLGSEIAAKALALKVLNLCLAKYHFLAQSTSVLTKPFGLILDPSNFCNLQCPGCVHSPSAKQHFRWDGSTMTGDQFERFAKRYAPFATHMMLCNYGEPLLNKNTPAFIQLAKSYLTRTALSTSLSVGKVDAEAYVRSGLDFMIMSIDGATQPVYERYRRNGNIDYVYQNIRNLVNARKQLGKGTPILHWQFLAFEHNEHEIPLAIERARELGVDQIHICTPNDVSWDAPEVKPSKVESRLISLTDRVSQRLEANIAGYDDPSAAEVISREFDRSWQGLLSEVDYRSGGYEPLSPSEHTCRWVYTNMTMDATGRIIPCCAAPSKSFDLTFGQFSEVEEAFNSEKYRISRRHFANPGVSTSEAAEFRVLTQPPHCVNCQWDQDHTNVSNDHVRQYLSTVAGGILNTQTMDVLCSW